MDAARWVIKKLGDGLALVPTMLFLVGTKAKPSPLYHFGNTGIDIILFFISFPLASILFKQSTVNSQQSTVNS
ncbi:MAG: hypothetical protein QQW96_04715 [Tychonema bourrellyi B0820]|nr:hypothetical protein [Tychonema bourrellyi B0820]